MKDFKLVLFITLVFMPIFTMSLSKANASAPQSLKANLTCNYNCAEVIHLGSQYVVVAVDRKGDVFFVQSLDIPPDAVSQGVTESIPSQYLSTSASSEAGNVDSTERTYVTSTEIIVITTYIYYNADGDIVDVQVSEVRFPRGDVEEK
ncbi:hypothetical protein A28LD_1335 [Idiomarina sp. A28L]|uniref:hypothetical protein n=1 Tax=Idiomarina sp. A28L TaxID=1036674 RepID=UPI0002138800|nr:hypothetical protein [Idiomarina sp. A28L]EGN75160.1 hypothetical protein A28LD_1335 [Idiomarina sp. A28L]